ncbi:MAG: hypothetical protein LBH39_08680 [Clostridiales Family XIII bacterium]|jgi:hypothetical protein|nr:hypothetical protein [Clostridiales Family XIII bacterium]
MKKYAALFITILLLLGLPACSGGGASADPDRGGAAAGDTGGNPGDGSAGGSPSQSGAGGGTDGATDPAQGETADGADGDAVAGGGTNGDTLDGSLYGALSPLSGQSNNNGTQSVDISGAANSPDTPAHQSASEVAASMGSVKDGDIIDIGEKMFATQINEIYLNAEDYLGKTLRYQGMFQNQLWPETGVVYCYVVRNGPGCCGTDSNPGFEVLWDSDYPKADDWVEATGVLEAYEEDGFDYLRVRLSSLEVMDARGAETVYQ